MNEIFAEKLGPILVTDSVAKVDLLTSVRLGNGQVEMQPACRLIIPITEVESIIGRLQEQLRDQLKGRKAAAGAVAAAPADGAAGPKSSAPANSPSALANGPAAPANAPAPPAKEPPQSVVVFTIPKMRT
jgi:hypothetical protein